MGPKNNMRFSKNTFMVLGIFLRTVWGYRNITIPAGSPWSPTEAMQFTLVAKTAKPKLPANAPRGTSYYECTTHKISGRARFFKIYMRPWDTHLTEAYRIYQMSSSIQGRVVAEVLDEK